MVGVGDYINYFGPKSFLFDPKLVLVPSLSSEDGQIEVHGFQFYFAWLGYDLFFNFLNLKNHIIILYTHKNASE